jgi:hypothetical protein
VELEEVIGAVREALGQPVFSCADEGLLVGLRDCETVVRLALARQLALIAEVERRGLPGLRGYRNIKSLVQAVLRISGGEADSRVEVARRVEQRADLGGAPLPADLPATAEAVRDSAIGVEHARAVVDGMRKVHGLLSPQQYEQAEAMLVERARLLGPAEVRTLAARLAYHCDQDGALREGQRQCEDRELHYPVTRDRSAVSLSLRILRARAASSER